jgi:nicotinate phosphoribosyltransferase
MKYWNKNTISKIHKGYYSAAYFNRTKNILLQEKNLQTVTMQIFQKQNATICGINQVVELLKIGTGYFENGIWIDKYYMIDIQALSDGDTAKPWEPIMHIKGPYPYFAHLESLYL